MYLQAFSIIISLTYGQPKTECLWRLIACESIKFVLKLL